MGKYDDIINLPHHVSKKHPRLSMEQRAAQFAPFAALTGYDGQVKETARFTDEQIEIDEEIKMIISNNLQMIKEKINLKPKVDVTYFVADEKKSGGQYFSITGNIKKIDEFNHTIIFTDNKEILIKNIIKITETDIAKI